MIHYQDDAVTVHFGDCLDVLRGMPDASVDAVVTDPPYGLEFMGREWDKFGGTVVEDPADVGGFQDGNGGNPFSRSRIRFGAPGVAFQHWCETWATECLRVLKPGGHLLAFGGTRTWHRLACAIEDAGFEIRDSIHWIYGSGFSKSWNFNTQYQGKWCECGGVNPVPYSHADNADLSRVRADVHPRAVSGQEGQDADLLTSMQRPLPGPGVGEARAQGASGLVGRGGGVSASEDAGGAEPGVAGRHLHRAGEGLPNDPQPDASSREGEWVRGGAPARNGVDDRSASGIARGGASHQRRPGGQSARESEAVPGSHEPLDDRALRDGPVCPRCGGLDTFYRGVGTGIKPAHEPIVVARKPLAGTVAQTVLAHGTGALNIAGCRVGTSKETPASPSGTGSYGGHPNGQPAWAGGMDPSVGRWPPNVVLGPDAAAELDRQSGTSTSPFIVGRGTNQGGSLQQRASSWGGEATEVPGYGDSGGASRFFPIFRYEPKAPTSERPRVGGGSQSSIRNPRCLTCGRLRLDYEASRCQCAEPDWSEVAATTGIAHPTVKPLSLVRWLCRLVCPPGGVILDPFAGSGTTGEAAILEHKRAILIEREADYLPLIVARLSKPMALGFDLDGEAS